MPFFFSRSVAALRRAVWRSHSSLEITPALAPALRARMAPIVLSAMHPLQSTLKRLQSPLSTLPMAADTSSPIMVLAHVPTTAIVRGWNLCIASLAVRIRGSAPPNMRSLSLRAEVTTLTPAFSRGREAMKQHPAGPWVTMTSTSMSRRVYMAATMGLGRGCITTVTGNPL